MTTSTLDREVLERLQTLSIRYTSGRQSVVATLSTAEGPLSAGELHDAVDRSLPLSSIYRSLTVLEEAGVVAPHHGAKGITRFELAEWLRGHHHHLVCIDCGAVEDVELSDQHEKEVDRVVKETSDNVQFFPLTHALEIEGRCTRCA